MDWSPGEEVDTPARRGVPEGTIGDISPLDIPGGRWAGGCTGDSSAAAALPLSSAVPVFAGWHTGAASVAVLSPVLLARNQVVVDTCPSVINVGACTSPLILASIAEAVISAPWGMGWAVVLLSPGVGRAGTAAEGIELGASNGVWEVSGLGSMVSMGIARSGKDADPPVSCGAVSSDRMPGDPSALEIPGN